MLLAACAADSEDGLWGPLDEKADNMFGGTLRVVGTIHFDDSESFTFDGTAKTPAFRFHGDKGQSISSIATISNNAPPWLYLIDKSMKVIAQSTFDSAFDIHGRPANSISAVIPADGTYFIGLSSTYSRSRVKGATITIDLGLDDAQQCQPVTCELYCANGFKTDANGCEICQCK